MIRLNKWCRQLKVPYKELPRETSQQDLSDPWQVAGHIHSWAKTISEQQYENTDCTYVSVECVGFYSTTKQSWFTAQLSLLLLLKTQCCCACSTGGLADSQKTCPAEGGRCIADMCYMCMLKRRVFHIKNVYLQERLQFWWIKWKFTQLVGR